MKKQVVYLHVVEGRIPILERGIYSVRVKEAHITGGNVEVTLRIIGKVAQIELVKDSTYKQTTEHMKEVQISDSKST